MSTRRARKHKERTHIGRLVREHVNETNRGGLFDKRLNKVTCRPYKFRKRAYYRENDLEGKILEKKAQKSLGDVLRNFRIDKFIIELRTDKDEH